MRYVAEFSHGKSYTSSKAPKAYAWHVSIIGGGGSLRIYKRGWVASEGTARKRCANYRELWESKGATVYTEVVPCLPA